MNQEELESFLFHHVVIQRDARPVYEYARSLKHKFPHKEANNAVRSAVHRHFNKDAYEMAYYKAEDGSFRRRNLSFAQSTEYCNKIKANRPAIEAFLKQVNGYPFL